VKEKESRTKESMRIMGMTDFAYWLSWFVYYTIINTVIATIGAGVLMINVFTNSSFLYVWLYFWLFGEAVFGQVIMLQALFSRSKYAGIVSTIVYYVGSFLYFPVASPSTSQGLKVMMSIFP
jgi:uncharacterized membrane protein